MSKLSPRRRRAAALVVALGAIASVATSMTEWEVSDQGELPPIHLDASTPFVEYEVRATAQGTLDGSGELRVTLNSPLYDGNGNPSTTAHLTLRSAEPTDTVEVDIYPGPPTEVSIPAWTRCPGTPCEERFTLRLELAAPAGSVDLTGTVGAWRTGYGEQPSDVAVDVSVWSELVP